MQPLPQDPPQDTTSQPPATQPLITESLWEEISAADANINRQQRINNWILLGVSLLLFTGLGAFKWNLPLVIMLMVAIFIHEMGHVLGMKLFRYKNIKMLFIPLFGGAAVGTPGRQDSFRIAMISILGPVFGLLSCYVAVVAWHFHPQAFLIKYAWVAVFINAFNLLPILPLDGGHYMNETLFSRFPKAELIFNIIAVAALACIAYKWSSWMMGLLALFWAFTTPARYNFGKIAAKLRREETVAGGEFTKEKASKIYQEFVAVYPRLTQGPQAKNLATHIRNIWEKINKKFPSIPMTVLMVFIYLMTAFVFFVSIGIIYNLLTGKW